MTDLGVPDSIRFIDLYGILYFIEWEKLKPGYSFFLKTTASHRIVQKKLKPAEKYFNIILRARPRNEFGRFGVRVWML